MTSKPDRDLAGGELLRPVNFFIVDVFTAEPYSGNQLCVVPESAGLTDEQMQRIAAEIGFSETTFLSGARGQAPPHTTSAHRQPVPAYQQPAPAYRTRIFTPAKEVPFAGHPSLGSAYVMAMTGALELTEPATHIYQQLDIGLLAIELYVSDGVIVKVAMEQGEPVLSEPLDATRTANIMAALSLGRAAGPAPSDQATSRTPDGARSVPAGMSMRVSSTGLPALIVPLANEDQLNSAISGPGLAEALSAAGAELCYLFCRREGSTGHYVARAFAPALGIAEDPATGSAAGALGAYLSLTGQLTPEHAAGQLDAADQPPGRANTVHITIDQGHVINRPSRIEVEVRRKGEVTGQPGKPQIWVGGRCALVADGRFFI